MWKINEMQNDDTIEKRIKCDTCNNYRFSRAYPFGYLYTYPCYDFAHFRVFLHRCHSFDPCSYYDFHLYTNACRTFPFDLFYSVHFRHGHGSLVNLACVPHLHYSCFDLAPRHLYFHVYLCACGHARGLFPYLYFFYRRGFQLTIS